MKRLPAVFGLGALAAVVAIGIPAAMATGEPQGPDPQGHRLQVRRQAQRGRGPCQTGNNPISVSQNALVGHRVRAASFTFRRSRTQQANEA